MDSCMVLGGYMPAVGPTETHQRIGVHYLYLVYRFCPVGAWCYTRHRDHKIVAELETNS